MWGREGVSLAPPPSPCHRSDPQGTAPSCLAFATGVLLSGPMFSPCSPCARRHPYPSIGEAMRAGHHLPPSVPPGLFQWCPDCSGVAHVSPSLPTGTSSPPGSILGSLVPRHSTFQLVAYLLFRLLLGTCPCFGSHSPPWPSAEPLPLLSSATAFGTAQLSHPLAERCRGAGVLVPFAHQALAPHRFREVSWARSTPTLKTKNTLLAWMGEDTDPAGNLGWEGATH